MVDAFPTPGPSNVGWAIEDYDELSSDLSIFIEVETTREEEPRLDPRESIAYGPSRTIVRRSSYYGLIDEVELDGPLTYHHVQHPSGVITQLVGSVGGKPWIVARMLDARSQGSADSTPSRSKDMTEYTDEELAKAIHTAAYNRADSIYINHDTSRSQDQVHVSELNDFRAVLKHLPAKGESAWEWVPCTFEDVRKGDRVKRVITRPNGSTVAREGIATEKGRGFDTIWNWMDRDGFSFGFSSDENNPHVTYSRIPAPVVHPDPAEHPVIYVKDCDIVNFIPKIMVWYRCSYVAGRQCISPERITDWSPIDPAKVIADE